MVDIAHYALERLVGQVVVLDLASPYVYVGRLVHAHTEYLVLEDADCHDLRDTATNREQYVRDCRLYGVTRNRGRVWVNRRELVGISLLSDVLTE